MDSPCESKSVSDATMDLISELPADVSDRIFECLPTLYAARIALLSTHWKDVWLRYAHLVFDSDFFESAKKYEAYERTGITRIITDILLFYNGPVKKFALHATSHDDILHIQQSDLDQWCQILSTNGVEELSLYILGDQPKLPSCIFSCPTIKKLRLESFMVVFPVNATPIFPEVTSLDFKDVWFKQKATEISPHVPKLESLTVSGFTEDPKLRWFRHCLESIKSLCLRLSSSFEPNARKLPTAPNLQMIKFDGLNFNCVKHFNFALQLLQKSPKICKLEIVADEDCWCDDKRGPPRLLEDYGGNFFNHGLKMLSTIKMESCRGSKYEMLFVKTLLSKIPRLENVFIQKKADIDSALTSEIQRELSCAPRASPNAQIIFME